METYHGISPPALLHILQRPGTVDHRWSKRGSWLGINRGTRPFARIFAMAIRTHSHVRMMWVGDKEVPVKNKSSKQPNSPAHHNCLRDENTTVYCIHARPQKMTVFASQSYSTIDPRSQTVVTLNGRGKPHYGERDIVKKKRYNLSTRRGRCYTGTTHERAHDKHATPVLTNQ